MARSIYEQSDGGLALGRINSHDGRDDLTGLNDPLWTPNPQPDRDKGELVVPNFRTGRHRHPIPPVAEMLWILTKKAGMAPPWRVRVAPKMCWRYTLRATALALAPHAEVLMTPDGRSPAPMLNPEMDIEFNYTDQRHAPVDAPVGQRLILPGQVR